MSDDLDGEPGLYRFGIYVPNEKSLVEDCPDCGKFLLPSQFGYLVAEGIRFECDCGAKFWSVRSEIDEN